MTSKKMAIFTGSDIRALGGGRYMMELSNRLTKFKTTIFSTQEEEKIRISHKEVKKLTTSDIVYYKAPKFPITQENMVVSYSGFKALLSLRDFDVIYNTDSSLLTNIQLIMLSKIFGKRLIFAMHDAGTLRRNPIKRTVIKSMFIELYNHGKYWVLRRVPNIHVLNLSDKNELFRIGYDKNIYHIPNFLYYDINEREVANNQKEFIALFVGRLDIEQKGIDLFGEIIEKVLKENRNIRFRIIAPKDNGYSIIRALINKYPRNIKLIGYVTSQRLRREYKRSSLFVLTSRTEGMPAVLLEAQSLGTPAVAFNIKGVNDVLASESQGRLIDNFDTNKFSDAILKYYKRWKSDRKAYMDRKRQIAKKIKETYSDKIIVPKLEKILNNE